MLAHGDCQAKPRINVIGCKIAFPIRISGIWQVRFRPKLRLASVKRHPRKRSRVAWLRRDQIQAEPSHRDRQKDDVLIDP